MRTRQRELGDRNIVGAKVEERRKELHLKQKDLLTQLQIQGIDLNASGLSKLEGQYRFVTDIELKQLAAVLHVRVDWLLGIVPSSVASVTE
jgi:transcriptional regulator with XRE-family HTH domain